MLHGLLNICRTWERTHS